MCLVVFKMILDTFILLVVLSCTCQLSADQWFNVFSGRKFYGTTIFVDTSNLCLSECLMKCNWNEQCAAAVHEKETQKCTGLSDEGGLMIGKVNTNINTCVKEKAWITAFIGQAGIGKKVYTEWTVAPTTSVDIKYESTCNCHYKSELVEKWRTLGVQKIRFSVFSSNTEDAYLIFDAKGSNKMLWFSANNLLNSSWSDLKGGVHDYFSLIGHHLKPANHERRFYINSALIECPQDKGWLVVLDKTGPGIGCHEYYEKGPIPVILYSSSGTMSNWNDVNKIKRADRFVIYFQARLDSGTNS